MGTTRVSWLLKELGFLTALPHSVTTDPTQGEGLAMVWRPREKPDTEVGKQSLLGDPRASLTTRPGRGVIWGCSGGFVLGDTGIVSAEVLLHAFAVLSVCGIAAGHRQLLQRCIVDLLP